MAKAKSEATIKKELETAAAVNKYYLEAKVEKRPYGWAKPAVAPAKLKSPSADILVRNAQFGADRAAWWRKVNQQLSMMSTLYATDSYVMLTSPATMDADIVVMSPHIGSKYTLKLGNGTATVTCLKAKMTPLAQITEGPFWDRAAYMTWPDQQGKVKIYAHASSIWVRKHLSSKWKDSNGLNMAVMSTLNKWTQLAEYIQNREMSGLVVPQRTVCDVVKTISQNLAMVEMEKEQKFHMEKNL